MHRAKRFSCMRLNEDRLQISPAFWSRRGRFREARQNLLNPVLGGRRGLGGKAKKARRTLGTSNAVVAWPCAKPVWQPQGAANLRPQPTAKTTPTPKPHLWRQIPPAPLSRSAQDEKRYCRTSPGAI